MSHSGYGGRNRGDGYRRNNNGRKQFQRLGGTDIVEPNAIVRGPSGLSLSLRFIEQQIINKINI